MNRKQKNSAFTWLISLYTLSALVFSVFYINEADYQLTEKSLGALCLSGVYAGYSLEEAEVKDTEEKTEEKSEEKAEVKAEEKAGEKVEQNVSSEASDEPRVLIVHTHATETYLPAKAGNYHSKEVEDSVREVGQVMKKTLEEEGIAAIHNQTLHDNPSYSNSYSRSYETVEAMVKKYPSIEVVIDLHRDAIAGEATGATVSVKGKVCARYMYVVGMKADNSESNLKFIKDLNNIAAKNFDGFTGTVLKREYEYNQGLAENCILLEVGNNRNQIENARNTAHIVGKILAEKLKES